MLKYLGRASRAALLTAVLFTPACSDTPEEIVQNTQKKADSWIDGYFRQTQGEDFVRAYHEALSESEMGYSPPVELKTPRGIEKAIFIYSGRSIFGRIYLQGDNPSRVELDDLEVKKLVSKYKIKSTAEVAKEKLKEKDIGGHVLAGRARPRENQKREAAGQKKFSSSYKSFVYNPSEVDDFIESYIRDEKNRGFVDRAFNLVYGDFDADGSTTRFRAQRAEKEVVYVELPLQAGSLDVVEREANSLGTVMVYQDKPVKFDPTFVNYRQYVRQGTTQPETGSGSQSAREKAGEVAGRAGEIAKSTGNKAIELGKEYGPKAVEIAKQAPEATVTFFDRFWELMRRTNRSF